MAETESTQLTQDVGRQQLAAVYAHALVGAAEKAGQLEPVLAELSAVVTEVLDAHPQFDAMLASPRVDEEDKAAAIDRVFGGRVSDTLIHFLKVLARRGRLDCLRQVERAARSILNERLNRVEVLVTTAEPINDQQRQRITERLGQLLGRQVQLGVETDSSLIGGMVVRVGDTLYDGSLANQLERLRAETIRKTIEEIRTSVDRFAESA